LIALPPHQQGNNRKNNAHDSMVVIGKKNLNPGRSMTMRTARPLNKLQSRRVNSLVTPLGVADVHALDTVKEMKEH
jgi:hypothetical protein